MLTETNPRMADALARAVLELGTSTLLRLSGWRSPARSTL